MALINQIQEPLLKKCWDSVYRGKSDRVRRDSHGTDDVSLKDFKDNETVLLREIYDQIQEGIFKLQPLSPVVKAKPGKSMDRLLTVPAVRDRIVHRAILCLINSSVYSYINTGVSYCGVKKDLLKKAKHEESLNTKAAIKKIIEHVSQHKFFIFESDIKGFFDNVPKKRMCKKIYPLLPDKSLNSLIENVINFEFESTQKLEENKRINLPLKDDGISQGSPLSPLFSNIYLAEFDRIMKKSYGDAFIRYVDDFLVICKTKKEAMEAQKLAESLLSKEGLLAASDKTFIKDLRKTRVVFLGIGLDKEKISTKKSKDDYLKEFREDVFTMKKYENIKKNQQVYLINSKVFGRFNYYKYYHVENIFKEINKIIEQKQKIAPRFKDLTLINISGLRLLISQKDWQAIFAK